MKTLDVKAAPGVAVPKEDAPRKYIEGETAVTVPDTAYYRRRIADGDLILTNGSTAETAATKKGGK